MRKMKKTLAVMLAATMTMSMGMTALAYNSGTDGDQNRVEIGKDSEENPIYAKDESTVSIKKYYVAVNDEKMKSPAETFEFTGLKADSVKNAASGVNVNNMPLPTLGSASFTEGAAKNEVRDAEDKLIVKGGEGSFTITLPDAYTNKESISIDTETGRYEKYPSVGEYTYTFAEKDNGTAGVGYRQDSIKLVVTVLQNTDGGLRVAAVHTESGNGDKSDDFNNTYSAGSLVVTKTVTGLLGDTNKVFDVKVTLKAALDEKVMGDITYSDQEGNHTIEADTDKEAEGVEGWNEKTVPIKVKNGTTVIFTNVPYGVTYEVVETDYSAQGYTTTYTAESNTTKEVKVEVENAEGEKSIVTKNVTVYGGTMNSASESVAITNDKGGTVDTGIVLDNAPYILLLVLAAVGMFGFVSKKRSAEF